MDAEIMERKAVAGVGDWYHWWQGGWGEQQWSHG